MKIRVLPGIIWKCIYGLKLWNILDPKIDKKTIYGQIKGKIMQTRGIITTQC
jgi:hypothetical protein